MGKTDTAQEAGATYQANPLIMARKGFDVQETRLFYLGMEHVNPHLPNGQFYDGDFKEIYIPMCELVKEFGGNKVFYTVLKEKCKKLFDKKVEINNGTSWKLYHVFSTMEFKDGDGLYIKFDSEMKPWLLDLFERGYTRIERKAIWGLSSSHAIRILELMLQYKKIGSREITIEALKQYLDIPEDSYKGRINNFKKRILDEPIAEINSKTPYKIAYKQIKKGVRIVAFEFTIKAESEATEATEAGQNVALLNSQVCSIRDGLISRGLHANVADKVQRKINIGEWQEEMIRQLIRKCDVEKPADSGRWLCSALFKPKSKYQKPGWHVLDWNRINQKGQNLPPRKGSGMESVGNIMGGILAQQKQNSNIPDSDKTNQKEQKQPHKCREMSKETRANLNKLMEDLSK